MLGLSGHLIELRASYHPARSLHRFATRSLLVRLRLACLFLILFATSCFLVPAAVVWGTVLHDPRGLQASMILLPAAFISGLLYLMIGSGVRCPLCRGVVLKRLGGTPTNSKARKIFGSHRLAIILGAFFAGHYRCMHCGEPCDTSIPRR